VTRFVLEAPYAAVQRVYEISAKQKAAIAKRAAGGHEQPALPHRGGRLLANPIFIRSPNVRSPSSAVPRSASSVGRIVLKELGSAPAGPAITTAVSLAAFAELSLV
jgi:hypothetical protein